jgi:hypothetical protein
MTATPAPRIATAAKSPLVVVACGCLGIVAGAAVLVGALAVPLDDPALVVALMLALRGGRLTLPVDS